MPFIREYKYIGTFQTVRYHWRKLSGRSNRLRASMVFRLSANAKPRAPARIGKRMESGTEVRRAETASSKRPWAGRDCNSFAPTSMKIFSRAHLTHRGNTDKRRFRLSTN